MIDLIIKLVLVAVFVYLQLYVLVDWLKSRRSSNKELGGLWVAWMFSWVLGIAYVFACMIGNPRYTNDAPIMKYASTYDIVAVFSMIAQALVVLGSMVFSRTSHSGD